MNELSSTRKHVEAAWHSFVVDGEPSALVRPEILRSWQRVQRDLRVDPALRTCPSAIAADEAAARAESDRAHRIAARLLSHFAGRLAADGHVIAYFDRDGVMLAVDGCRATRRRLADVNFAPGACWAESAAGTNGPGTALAEARPVEVFASEHFVEAWQPWTCASVPIVAAGRIVGVVDITSPWTAHNPSLLLSAEAFAHAIASEIEAETARHEAERLARRAREALRARDDVLAVASHELKTPLTPLRLGLQQVQRLLAREGEAVDPDQLRRVLGGADRHLGRLVKFMDDLLEAARVVGEPLQLALAPTDLACVVRDVVARHRLELEELGCDVRVDAPSEAIGRWDAARLAQAVEQLLVNAIRYAPGRIEVDVRAERATAWLRIRDHGPGIAPVDRERIFDPFERAVSCRNASGFGLGLHAVRCIVEAHGGSVHVESARGGGSVFVVALPLDVLRDRSNAPQGSRASTTTE